MSVASELVKLKISNNNGRKVLFGKHSNYPVLPFLDLTKSSSLLGNRAANATTIGSAAGTTLLTTGSVAFGGVTYLALGGMKLKEAIGGPTEGLQIMREFELLNHLLFNEELTKNKQELSYVLNTGTTLMLSKKPPSHDRRKILDQLSCACSASEWLTETEEKAKIAFERRVEFLNSQIKKTAARDKFVSNVVERVKDKKYGDEIVRIANEKTELYNEVALENIRQRTALHALANGIYKSTGPQTPTFNRFTGAPPSFPKVEKEETKLETAAKAQRRINEIEQFIPLIQKDTEKMGRAIAETLESLPDSKNRTVLLNFTERMVSNTGLKVDLTQAREPKPGAPSAWKKVRSKVLPKSSPTLDSSSKVGSESDF